MRELAREVFLVFRRGRGFPLSLLLLAGAAALFWIALQATGTFTVNGEPVDLDESARVALAIGLGVRAVSFLILLFLLFHGAGLVLGDAETGRAAFSLSAPISRARYLAGRSAGVLLVVLLFWAAALVLFEILLFSRTGSLRAEIAAGAAVIVLAQALLLGVLVLFRLFLGGGWGAMGALLVWIASAVLSLDLLESSLFAVDVPENVAPWWLPILQPFLGGEPIGWKADLVRAFVRLFPPIGNATSVGIDLALGRPVFPSFDWWSLPGAAVWGGLVWWGSIRLFRRRDW
ncbi:MAG: hypothetical protein FJY73_04845 [Candidatus Eisenbacteria bacterium]|nr:hypothetical protein [Candidatus Eisenbacteria bacterium]